MAPRESLAQTAIRCLNVASHNRKEGSTSYAPRYDAGSTVQPDSWLLEKCWQTLADSGFGSEAYSIAVLAELRHPLSPIKALHRMAKRSPLNPQVVTLVQNELLQARVKIFGDHLFAQTANQIDYILYAAASAALINETLFALSCLERLDQIPKAWDRVFVQPDLRQILAETIAIGGITPLTGNLIDKAILRYTESGAQFLQQTASATKMLPGANDQSSVIHPVLIRCVAALDFSVLGSLHSRKIASSVFAQAGHIEKMLEQVRTIATIQDAHRETNAMLNQRGGISPSNQRYNSRYRPADDVIEVSTSPGYSNLHSSAVQKSNVYNDTVRIAEMANTAAAERSRNFPVYRSSLIEADSSVIRQVSRTSADTDVDFLVYTLKAAIEQIDLEKIDATQRRTIINQLAALGLMSDGWTAAGATAALLTLGGLDEAIHVVEQIDPNDPTRIESVLALVKGLLDHGEIQLAQEQSQKALAWVARLPEVTPGRTLRRGLASTYIEHNLPEAALAILAGEQKEIEDTGSVGKRLSKRFFSGHWFRTEVTEEQLHADRVRLAAHLKQLTNQLAERHQHEQRASADLQMQEPYSAQKDGPQTQPSIAELSLFSEQVLPPELDKLIHTLSTWAPQLLDGEALIVFYRDSLLIPLLNAGKVRYAWGLLSHIREALLKLQSNKMPTRLQQIAQPMTEQIVALTRYESEIAQHSGGASEPHLAERTGSQAEAMTAYLIEFMASLWETSAEREIWPAIYAIEGCLSAIVTLFGPDPLVEIAQATVEQGALWGAR